MLDLVPPEQLQTYVPGIAHFGSDPATWQGAALCAYHYEGLDVEIPALRDFTIVAFTEGRTQLDRRVDGPWQRERIVPGDVAVLTRATPSHWSWDKPIEVLHLYVTQKQMAKVTADVLNRDIAGVELRDVLRVEDHVLNQAIAAIAEEVRHETLGGRLYVEAVTTQVCVHLLRKYANVSMHTRPSGGLSHCQARMVEDYIEANLDRSLSLDELAAVSHTSASHFLRQFKTRYGVPPHAYVIHRRVERAQQLLKRSALPIKDIASSCGFSDQSHMTRVFQRVLNTTPCGFRQAVVR